MQRVTLPDLVNKYAELDEGQQLIMQALACSGKSLTMYELTKFFDILRWELRGPNLGVRGGQNAMRGLEALGMLTISQNRIKPLPVMTDYLVRMAHREQRAEKLNQVFWPAGFTRGYDVENGQHLIMDVLDALYRSDDGRMERAFNGLYPGRFPLLEPFDATIYAGLSAKSKNVFARHMVPRILDGYLLQSHAFSMELSAALTAWLHRSMHETVDVATQAVTVDWGVATGDLLLLQELEKVTQKKKLDVIGCRALLEGDYETAVVNLSKNNQRQPTTKTLTKIGALPSLLYLLLRLSGRFGGMDTDIVKACDLGLRHSECYRTVYMVIREAYSYRLANAVRMPELQPLAGSVFNPMTELARAYLSDWLRADHSGKEADRAKSMQAADAYFGRSGCRWLRFEVARLAGTAIEFPESWGCVSMAERLQPPPLWEQQLQSIADIFAPGLSAVSSAGHGQNADPERLIFEVAFTDKSLHFEAYQQTLKSSGWTKGKKIAIRRLLDSLQNLEFKFLTSTDREIIKSVRVVMQNTAFGTVQEVLEVDQVALARAMTTHPNLYAPGNRDQALEVTEESPRLIVEQLADDQVQLRVEPRPVGVGSRLLVRHPSHAKLVVTVFSKELLKLHEMLGTGLKIPSNGLGRLPDILRPLSSIVTVHSEVDLGDSASGDGGLVVSQAVDGDATPHVHVIPNGAGYSVEVYSHPFGPQGPHFRPGEGGTKLFATIEGQAKIANRDLANEKAAVDQLYAACPHLRNWLQGPWTAQMPSPIETLEVLLELEAATQQGQVVVIWPQGRMLQIAGRASSSQMRVRIKKENDWFAATGELQVDDELSLGMAQLVDLVANNRGRFVKLDDGRFLALTEQLRKQIEDLGSLADRRTPERLRLSKTHAAVLDEMPEIEVQADKHWRDLVQRLHSAQEMEPQKPTTLQADLRDYQEEGYRWMTRLAAWGVGGCLADDMGLGKTVQAIALLLDRATGPALVIAPTSVVFNWANEIERFAPTLRPRLVADEAIGDELNDLQPNDVVLCSYGLLTHRTAMLQATEWNTLILDEAQAIKNVATQRSQAAKSLSANYRLIMTGTPIENHLGELWNLMDFVNPGLLGSAESFVARFAAPIERDQCRDTRARLKKVISPFLLRRTKTQVLTELPSRTEITLHVKLSPAEVAFYEALRKKAMNALEGLEDVENSHLQVLAEIMRLRRACCHPSLVAEGVSFECSKLKLFTQTVQELLEGGHKALVFSQFVDHLAVLRAELERLQISYQYLDGSTPAPQRKKRVEAFQAGEGDLFLISLKAGGAGLNLTAADYVLHMDPWWNPAVEDQASDRAHRMGQKRPVTIYRFITEGTIEHKIQQLHGTKRDLADSLLEGTDRSGKLSTSELLAMLRG